MHNGVIEMYTDASFAEDVITRKSVSGYASVKNKAVITYGVKGQTKVALSSGDAELRALSECKREADLAKCDLPGSLVGASRRAM